MSGIRHALRTIFPPEEKGLWYPSENVLEDFDRRGKDYSSCLEPSVLRDNALWAALPLDWEDSLLRGADLIRGNPLLQQSFSLVSDLLIRERGRYDSQNLRFWPDPEKEMGREAPVFFLLVMLNCIPVVRDIHRKRGIPEAVTRDTCSGIGTKGLGYFFHFNRPGVMKWELFWFQHHMEGKLFRVGRLEYMVKKVHEGLTVYRQKNTGQTRLVLPSPGDKHRIVVFPDGSIDQETSEEILRDWIPCLTGEDFVLDVHIPGGGGLTLEVVKNSFLGAVEFFDALLPEVKTKGFECISWIFSRDLEALFEPGANLIRLRDQVSLFPVESEKVEGIPYICGSYSGNPADWPEKTSLQRRLKAHVEKGGAFRQSGMIFLREDLERFGSFPWNRSVPE